jgi:predicted nucleotidyltransferase
MRVDAAAVLARRRREREDLLGTARQYAARLSPALGVRTVCVFGSVARGDFNLWSDIDVLVVAESLPLSPLQRLEALGEPLPLVQPVAWTPSEFAERAGRRDPIAVEALERGVWLVGSPEVLGIDNPTT